MEAKLESGRLFQIVPEELQDAPRPKDFVPIWKRFQDEMADVPDEILDQLPKDGAKNLDFYLYGTPKHEDEAEK
jgi:hypothetical protein